MTFLPFLETRGLFKRYKYFRAHSSPGKWKCESDFLQLHKSTKNPQALNLNFLFDYCQMTTLGSLLLKQLPFLKHPTNQVSHEINPIFY